jgi:hypothetical protein
VVIPRLFGIIAMGGRRLMPRRLYEAIDRGLGADRVFMGDVDVEKRRDYAKRAGTF